MKYSEQKLSWLLGAGVMAGGISLVPIAQACGYMQKNDVSEPIPDVESPDDTPGVPPIEPPANSPIESSIAAIFTSLDGLEVGTRELSKQETNISGAILDHINSMEIGVINPSNLGDATFNSFVEGSTIDFNFANSMPLVTSVGGTIYSIEVPNLNVEVQSGLPHANSDLTYQGIKTGITGNNVKIIFGYKDEDFSFTALSGGTLSRVSPNITLGESKIRELFADTISRLKTGSNDNFNFELLITDDSVLEEDMSLYSFINYLSYTAGMSSAFLSGRIANDLDISISSISNNSFTLGINSDVDTFLSSSVLTGSWSTNAIQSLPNHHMYLSETGLSRQINVEIFGTQENPIFLFNKGEEGNYGKFQMESLGNMISKGLITTSWPKVDLYQDFILEANTSLGPGVAINSLIQTEGNNFNSMTYANNTYTSTMTNIRGVTTNSPFREINADTMTVVANFNTATQKLYVTNVSGLFFL